MFKVHRNLYDAQEKGNEVKIETHEVEPESAPVQTGQDDGAQEQEEQEGTVKECKKRKKAKKEEV